MKPFGVLEVDFGSSLEGCWMCTGHCFGGPCSRFSVICMLRQGQITRPRFYCSLCIPSNYSRHPGDIPVGLDPQLSMSKKNDGRNPAVNTADCRAIAVQDALAELLVRLRRKELHYYSFIGNNNDSLMNVLGCSPIMCGAVMHTAGILGV